MNSLTLTTQRRLKKLLQQPTVWEGDRRSLTTQTDAQGNLEQCIIWVDRSEGCVRAMEVVSSDLGPEAVVRTLIRAMETPMGPIKPCRPQKILVRNREVQFFLRGALQSLNITVEYEAELPLIDEIFRTFAESQSGRPPALPPRYNSALQQLAKELWDESPWEYIADYEIIAIDLKDVYSQTLYVCVLGMSEQEYGLIFYRALDSLKRFRQAAIIEDSMNDLEQIFLSQDCWFLNYEALEEFDFDEDEESNLSDLDATEVEPILGSLHPYEGLRRFLDEEESGVIYLSLQALLRFFRSSQRELEQDTVVALTKTYNLPLFPSEAEQEMIPVTVSTQPEVVAELLQMLEGEAEENTFNVPINADLIPDNALINLELLSRDMITKLLDKHKTPYDSSAFPSSCDLFPAVLIQTTRPKAKEIIETIEEQDSLKLVCLHQAENTELDLSRELGLMQTNSGQIYLFSEFDLEDTRYRKLRQKWATACQKTQNRCSVIIAMGVTGSASGRPEIKDMLGIFQAQFVEDIKEITQAILPHKTEEE